MNAAISELRSDGGSWVWDFLFKSLDRVAFSWFTRIWRLTKSNSQTYIRGGRKLLYETFALDIWVFEGFTNENLPLFIGKASM